MSSSSVIVSSVAFALIIVIAGAPGVLGEQDATVPTLKVTKWMNCIHRIHQWFQPLDRAHFRWLPNDCHLGEVGSMEAIRDKILLAQRKPLTAAKPQQNAIQQDVTFSFSGDSTGIRPFIHAWNRYFDPIPPIPFQKVADAPHFMETVNRTIAGSSSKEQAVGARLRYFRLMYLSLGARAVRDAISTSNGGMLVLMLGNWDLNWKIQLNKAMPGLVGGVHNYTAAKVYWTKYVDEMFDTIREVMQEMPKEKRPVILIREQMLPNCDAPRFSGKKRKYRQCAPLVRPEVVPMYRRVLAGIAWSYGVPVIPMDPLFRDSYRFCGLSDGLHLDGSCYDFEQQLIWNSYWLLRPLVDNGSVVQGVAQSGIPTPPPKAWSFLSKAVYETWGKEFVEAVVPLSSPLPVNSPAPTPDATGSDSSTSSLLIDGHVTVAPKTSSLLKVIHLQAAEWSDQLSSKKLSRVLSGKIGFFVGSLVLMSVTGLTACIVFSSSPRENTRERGHVIPEVDQPLGGR